MNMFGLLTYPEARLVKSLVLELGCSCEKVKRILCDMRGGRGAADLERHHPRDVVGFAEALLGQSLIEIAERAENKNS